MPRILLLLIGCLVVASAHAQVKFNTLDSLASVIRKNHNVVTGMSYANETEAYELSFPQDNFNILAVDHTVYHSVYKKKDGKDLLYITENVDLANADRIELVDSKEGCIVTMLKLGFPKGYLKTQVMEDGRLSQTTSPDYLEFYVYNDVEKNEKKKLRTEHGKWAALKTVVALCNQLKIENGTLSAEMSDIINNRFDEMLNDDNEDIPRMERFVANFPKSLYTPLIKESIKQRNEYNANIRPVRNFIISIIKEYKYRSMYSDFQNVNPEAIKLLTNKYEHDGITYYTGHYTVITPGPAMMMQKGDKVIRYTTYLKIVDKKDIQLAENEFGSWVTRIKKEIPENSYQMSSTGDIESIMVKQHDMSLYVVVNYIHYNKAMKHAIVELGIGIDEKE